jgi:hypothetical protein
LATAPPFLFIIHHSTFHIHHFYHLPLFSVPAVKDFDRDERKKVEFEKIFLRTQEKCVLTADERGSTRIERKGMERLEPVCELSRSRVGSEMAQMQGRVRKRIGRGIYSDERERRGSTELAEVRWAISGSTGRDAINFGPILCRSDSTTVVPQVAFVVAPCLGPN